MPISSSAAIFLMKGKPDSTAVCAISAVLPLNASPWSKTWSCSWAHVHCVGSTVPYTRKSHKSSVGGEIKQFGNGATLKEIPTSRRPELDEKPRVNELCPTCLCRGQERMRPKNFLCPHRTQKKKDPQICSASISIQRRDAPPSAQLHSTPPWTNTLRPMHTLHAEIPTHAAISSPDISFPGKRGQKKKPHRHDGRSLTESRLLDELLEGALDVLEVPPVRHDAVGVQRLQLLVVRSELGLHLVERPLEVLRSTERSTR